ncbi:glycosyltransferase family 2 protein [Patescibacteria group bacterium]|nr:glycosyltransferase family 2 protein [Patescibacteria group bacterium]
MDLSIIIVSWNVKEKLRENLLALFKSEGDVSFEMFVADNNSQDGTAEMVKNEFSFNGVKLIANAENLGFAKANNQAIKQARGEFILLLNPDMRVVLPDTLSNMVKWMRENKQASVAGCRLIDEQGNTIKHVRKFPTVWDQLAIVLKLPHIFPNVLDKYLRVDFDYSKDAKVDSVRGGFFMLRRTSPRPSPREGEGELLDERYFLWFEEVDFCRQVYEKKGEVWHTPAAECVDYVGQSFKQLPRGKTQKYFRDSMLKYFKKWHPAWQYRLLKLVWPIGMLITRLGEKTHLKSKANT